MKTISRIQTSIVAMALLAMLTTASAFADLSPHTKAVLDGTMHKSQDDKGYVIHVDSAKGEDGKEIAGLKGTDMAMPEKMADEMMKCCESMVGKPCRVECTIKDGKITEVKSVTGRDMTKPGTKGGN